LFERVVVPHFTSYRRLKSLRRGEGTMADSALGKSWPEPAVLLWTDAQGEVKGGRGMAHRNRFLIGVGVVEVGLAAALTLIAAGGGASLAQGDIIYV
jgi:hypothetical protein